MPALRTIVPHFSNSASKGRWVSDRPAGVISKPIAISQRLRPTLMWRDWHSKPNSNRSLQIQTESLASKDGY
jgi:hypothetical protein